MIVSDTVLVALIVTIGTIINALIGAVAVWLSHEALTAVRETHELVNGVTAELRQAEVGQASAEGREAGAAAERDRPA